MQVSYGNYSFYEGTNKNIDTFFSSAVDFGGRYIYPDKHEDKKHLGICSEHMDDAIRAFLIRITIMCLSFCVAQYGILRAYYIDGTIATLTEVRIPFTAAKSKAELMGNFILEYVIALHGFPAYIFMDIILELIIGIAIIAPKLMANEFRKLDDAIENEKFTKLQVYLTFRNIVEIALDAEE